MSYPRRFFIKLLKRLSTPLNRSVSRKRFGGRGGSFFLTRTELGSRHSGYRLQKLPDGNGEEQSADDNFHRSNRQNWNPLVRAQLKLHSGFRVIVATVKDDYRSRRLKVDFS